MRSWKHIFIALVVLPVLCNGQDFVLPVQSVEDLQVSFNVSNATLDIKGHDRSEVIIKSRSPKSVRIDERAEGLRTITSVEDNTGIGLHVEEIPGEIRIIKTTVHTVGTYEILLPMAANVYIEETRWNGRAFNLSNLNGNVEILSNNSDIHMVDIYGSVRAKTTSGEIVVNLPAWDSTTNHKISSVSGLVDVTFPGHVNASIKMNTISGVIITSFDMEVYKEYKGSTLKRIGRFKKGEKHLNGGGGWLEVRSVSGVVKLTTK